MLEQEVLELLGADVLALADDHVLQPPGDREVARAVESTEISSSEEPLLVEGARVEGRVEVALHELRRLRADLALLVRSRGPTLEFCDAELDARRRPAFGVREH